MTVTCVSCDLDLTFCPFRDLLWQFLKRLRDSVTRRQLTESKEKDYTDPLEKMYCDSLVRPPSITVPSAVQGLLYFLHTRTHARTHARTHTHTHVFSIPAKATIL